VPCDPLGIPSRWLLRTVPIELCYTNTTGPDSMQPRILIDTFNSRLVESTGIGVYTRVLTAANQQLGHEVFLLTDTGIPFDRTDPKMREILSAPDSVLSFDHPNSVRSYYSGRTWYIRHGLLGWYLRNRLPSKFPFRLLTRAFPQLLARVFPQQQSPVHLVDQLDFIDQNYIRRRLGNFDGIINGYDLFKSALHRFETVRQPTIIDSPIDVDIAHFTWCLPIRIRNAKMNIYTLHDLIPLRFPFLTLDEKSTYYELVKWCCQTAERIATVSEHSRKEIIDLFGVSPAKVFNTFEAVETSANPDGWQIDEIKRSLHSLLGLKYAEYFVLAGAIEPRKNVATAIEAHLSAATDFPLIICGVKGPLSASELKLLAADSTLHGHRDAWRGKIIVCEYLPRYLLEMLMTGARALLAPSITEGFGLAPLEAMSLGTPVIASNTGALPEVCGAAAIYVDPYKPADLRRAIEKVAALSANDLDDLRSKARAQAQHFSFENYCSRLRGLYDSTHCKPQAN
jgi:glycosyltransferase involved in cell wall biosynthesis